MVEWGGRRAITRRLLPTREAQWIWAPGIEGEPIPVRFFMVRQFELPFAVSAARLLASADEEYEVHLNGTWVGSNRFAAGTVDSYDVASLVQLGTNTLRVELRSTHSVMPSTAGCSQRTGKTRCYYWYCTASESEPSGF